MLSLRMDYVNSDFEKKVSELIPKVPIRPGEERNQVLRWGETDYTQGFISKEIPTIFQDLILDLQAKSVALSEYYPAQYLDWHFDKIPEWDVSTKISIISLRSPSVIGFHREKTTWFYLPQYSLLRIGFPEYTYEHRNLPLDYRISLVFRS